MRVDATFVWLFQEIRTWSLSVYAHCCIFRLCLLFYLLFFKHIRSFEILLKIAQSQIILQTYMHSLLVSALFLYVYPMPCYEICFKIREIVDNAFITLPIFMRY